MVVLGLNDIELDHWPKPDMDAMQNVHYLHDLFPPEFLERLREEMWDTPVTSCSNNMYANRHFIRSPKIASQILNYLPKHVKVQHVLSDMKFIEYPAGGYIAPHVDGVRNDEETGLPSTTSFLLYLEDVPPGEGGETEFLTSVHGDGTVVWGVRPRAGSILIFPHDTPHQGAGVGLHPKVLLRGDMY
mmetsp:Transcript_24726/g.46835  ORF Transcript_24726/g.46835 Transcript_24726/m.46835 type:complete len:187 (-) Transcript_24726:225-785(-)|eukprot:CAMPEP_0114234954 /NCGR_PEP_ID=MMETSP0058-20121206/5982_1 /TAXON_ID=36894 /ORGANISM="Pyramimonas parkeae, CCMP726" /LENGTH=186 /DNA_ID=CAMNT_0001346663 /DNA_START=149 /DNA_END=709 /DNA_ORIENTATION=-